jgi:hypothetical protein
MAIPIIMVERVIVCVQPVRVMGYGKKKAEPLKEVTEERLRQEIYRQVCLFLGSWAFIT